MSEIQISKVIIHELVKIQHKPIKESKLRKDNLNPKAEPVRVLVSGVSELYGKRNNTAHYGTFRVDEGRGRFPDSFENYAILKTPSDDEFLDLSLTAMKALYQAAEMSPPASGGYILFADYFNSQGRFFLVAMIKQKDGLTLSEELVPENLSQLDLSRLYQAAKINFSKLSAYNTATPTERQELNYLSFVSPSSHQSAAGYFVTAIGCSPGTAAAKATRTIVKESYQFFKNNEELNKFSNDFKNDLVKYMLEKHEKRESVKLSEVEKLARKYIPADESEKADKIAEDLISHLNSEKNSVPVEFPPTKSVLNSYRQIHYRADDWDFTFERSSLGENEGARVYYDRRRNRIILNELPEKFVKLINEELENEIME